ncbi:nucleotide-binding universal stress UspA family protein [Rhodococcus sp. SMB37]|uniref:universal stress protein n=1 Tax=Rhodococcus sp. SMB37 TaxID=2512213 RepID=UPI001045112C|nr:universal stress protein [Rhodococcus sp. SMB37]TCN54808.1 nucleotide-binding universal stress UspA family protein [Rhodococcus sp. SMB37]
MNAHRPIIVGVDGSPSSSQAVSWGAREALLRDVPLQLLTTVPVLALRGIPIGMPATFFEEEESDGRQRLAAAAKHADETVPGGTIEIETHICTGTPPDELIERSKSASIMVIGAARRGPFGWQHLGSVSAAVAAHAHAPVVVVRALPHVEVTDIVGPVVVGVDGSENSEAAITMAFEEASLRDAELVAVHAWSDFEMRASFDHTLDWESLQGNEQAVLSEKLAGRADQFPNVRVRSVVVMDRPVHHLQLQAADAQLLVVGSRGRGGFASMLLGSTSRALLHSVTCPVMIARSRPS